MSQKANILNCHVDKLTMDETIKLIDKSIQNKSKLQHVVVNAAKLVNMQSDIELHNSVVSCDIINADGQAVVWASKILGDPLPERVAGIDIMENLVVLAYQKNYKIFFLGAKEKIVKAVVDKYSRIYSSDIIAGYRNGYFKKTEERDVAKHIASSGADILFVAITSPKKENFLSQNSDLLARVSFTMGVGGSFDVVSGFTKRAPVWMQKVGLEWFYRFAQEPKRMWKRYLRTNTLFIWYVLKAKFGS
ncbi:WecB/TagA/CpsF family glycosyltransferase [Carboxylicivirga sp. RSCT41]|uniref:WecB/TagA/CpsF family glycosyltransferase n=1 Tax=Carboxylicivirga agarovorans TaxID=3417570 RepID=UPI003D330E7D